MYIYIELTYLHQMIRAHHHASQNDTIRYRSVSCKAYSLPRQSSTWRGRYSGSVKNY